MYKYFFIILFIFSTLLLHAKEDRLFFAEVVTNNKSNEIIVGDSAVFSVWLYSVYPFGEIKCTNADFRIHNCHVRKVLNHQRRNQSRRYIGNRIYYCTLWAQYIIGSNKKGTFTIPSLDFSATLYIQQEQEIDPFDPFGFFSQPKYKKVSKECSSESVKISVVPEPMKTTEELMKSGKTVI